MRAGEEQDFPKRMAGSCQICKKETSPGHVDPSVASRLLGKEMKETFGWRERETVPWDGQQTTNRKPVRGLEGETPAPIF